MKFNLCFLFVFFTLIFPSLAQIDWQNLEMGSSAKKWQGKLTDISNPNSLDEKEFELSEQINFFGLKSGKNKLSYYNDRLFAIRMEFPANEWENLKTTLTSKIDANGKIYEDKKEGYWYYDNSKKQFAVFTQNNTMSLHYTDNTQKDFHWKDLFSGSLFYVLVIIVGGVSLWYLIAWLWVSYCPQCRSLSMEFIGREAQTRFRQDPNQSLVDAIFSNDPGEMYFKTYDHYKCKKCGYKRVYKGKSKNT
ncbi:MAG: hypothetical protein ACK40K_06010 [Raineya sp.]